MRIRMAIPLPGPFYLTSGRHHAHRKGGRKTPADPGAVLVGVFVFIVALIVAIVALATSPAPASGATVDPGAALYGYLHAHGATMPPSWAQVVDSRHASACAEFAADYTDYPAGYVDEFGVNSALAHAAVSATGFCS